MRNPLHARIRPPPHVRPSVAVRQLIAADLAGLDRLLSALDHHARYQRWLTPTVDVRGAAEWAAHPEQDHAVGLVATAGDRDGDIVGHAALVPIDRERAEVCFEVAAPWRRQGVATALLGELDLRARQRGFRTLVADVLTDNSDMLGILRGHGPSRECRRGRIVELEVPVHNDDAADADPALGPTDARRAPSQGA